MSDWLFPLPKRYKVTQRFGARPQYYRKWGFPGHEGVDYGAPIGTPVYAMRDGTVKMVHRIAHNHNYGLHVRLTHKADDAEYETIYAHLERIDQNLQIGDLVQKGQTIGYVGSTGNSTGPHLHITIKKKGASDSGKTHFPRDVIDPEEILKSAAIATIKEKAK
ncbi:MAG: M23 family metallopeptidase [Aggregatilineales bacterium]